jgi:hypothetical protein
MVMHVSVSCVRARHGKVYNGKTYQGKASEGKAYKDNVC